VIEVVVSDFGGVLTTPLERSFTAFSEESGVPLRALGAALAAVERADGAHPLHELETGRLSEAAFLDRVAGALGDALGRPVDMRGFPDAYFAHLDPNEAMLAALRRWRDRGLRLALCTNNVAEWEPRWRAMLPVDELFEVVVDSAFVRVRKPDPEIYGIVCERLGGVAPQACLLIDDLAANCEGARAVGMHAVRFADTEQAIADVEAALAGS
jgi:putative hydrolase of the HAD superfamily